jgi:hypothetical protein
MELALGRPRLFVDLDGTLAIFKPVDTIETLYKKGYFLNLQPISNVVQAIKEIIHSHPEIEVNTLSAYLSDSQYALDEKNQWLDNNIPEITQEHRLFVPCGTDKKDFIKDGVRNTDFLLDDYTENLALWEPPARGIKLLNGINSTHGTWVSDRLRFDKSPAELATNIVSIVLGRDRIRDKVPTKEDSAESEYIKDDDERIGRILRIKENIEIKQKEYELAETNGDYQACENLSASIGELNSRVNDLEVEVRDTDNDKLIGDEEKMYSAEDCIDGSTNGNYSDHILIIKPEALVDDFKKSKYQFFLAQGGMGCDPDAFGTKITGVFLCDGEISASFQRNDFMGVAQVITIPHDITEAYSNLIFKQDVAKIKEAEL